MWLLSTDRAELRFFSSLEQAQREGYAILSHVWGDVEQTFQETQALRKVGKPEDGYNPRDHSSPKVQMSCIVAELHGYRWIWNDTCCIDKTSSSELSEAINSMFSYYAHAEVCYVHLGDVPPDTPIRRYGSFAQSRWFRRGWTLQELVAPAQVIFLSSTWAVMGTKADHANALADITGIPKTIMTFEEEIWDVSIASRMSWASWRTTTRPEDEAYSLMGIFDVHMPTIYGEGRNAFRRLQEEIMRRSIDTTLFAWGEVSNFLPDREQIRSCNNGHDHNNMYLLATSPLDFRNCIRYQFAPKTERVVLLADKVSVSSSRYV
ncbi:HET-domain-containing protein [Lentinus tigrinus ALCF2SS1-6]|uniref:HET-domain-containing protein n=1 Tax=Lentinus tigrinus ALCF2SS1-6 TaxID=1328759 RepID=A0A5C2S507_9APHY|nr:HET-domain-containing protein [Lentinus tigrinus ALCF2SS1-6]